MLTSGKILRFDEIKGYGFIAPDDGSEDVFVHANDLRGEKSRFRSGTTVTFELEDGDRGPWAAAVRTTAPQEDSDAGKVVSTPARASGTVLESDQFQHRVTEAILGQVPTITAEQLMLVRTVMTELAQELGWVTR